MHFAEASTPRAAVRGTEIQRAPPRRDTRGCRRPSCSSPAAGCAPMRPRICARYRTKPKGAEATASSEGPSADSESLPWADPGHALPLPVGRMQAGSLAKATVHGQAPAGAVRTPAAADHVPTYLPKLGEALMRSPLQPTATDCPSSTLLWRCWPRVVEGYCYVSFEHAIRQAKVDLFFFPACLVLHVDSSDCLADSCRVFKLLSDNFSEKSPTQLFFVPRGQTHTSNLPVSPSPQQTPMAAVSLHLLQGRLHHHRLPALLRLRSHLGHRCRYLRSGLLGLARGVATCLHPICFHFCHSTLVLTRRDQNTNRDI